MPVFKQQDIGIDSVKMVPEKKPAVPRQSPPKQEVYQPAPQPRSPPREVMAKPQTRVEQEPLKEVLSVPDELRRNQAMATDPEWLLNLLRRKLSILNKNIKTMQKNNLSTEKASIDSLLVLKDFNEEVR